jgi:hypothetical protein
MKKVILTLSIIIFMLIALIVAHVGCMAIEGPRLDASSKAYVDANVPAIISTWSWSELRKLASSEFRETLNDDQMNLFLPKLKQLGSFQKYDGSTGQSYISLTIKNGKVITAHYTASAIFQNGPAEIHIGLILKNGQWEINSFDVKSPNFLNN